MKNNFNSFARFCKKMRRKIIFHYLVLEERENKMIKTKILVHILYNKSITLGCITCYARLWYTYGSCGECYEYVRNSKK